MIFDTIYLERIRYHLRAVCSFAEENVNASGQLLYASCVLGVPRVES